MAAHLAPSSLGFSRQEHWSGLPFPSPMHESEKIKWSRSVVFYSSNPMGCSPPGPSVHGIFQARVLEWVAISFSCLSEEALKIAEKRKMKSKGERESYTQLNPSSREYQGDNKKAFLSEKHKEIEKNNRMKRLEISSRKLEIPREHFMQRWAR